MGNNWEPNTSKENNSVDEQLNQTAPNTGTDAQGYNQQNGAPQQNYNQPNGMQQGGQPYNNASPGYQPNGYQQNNYQNNQPKNNDGMATAALILGIVAILCCAPAGIAGLIIGISNKDKVSPDKRSLCTAGIITSIIGLALWIIGIIIYVVIVAAAVESGEFDSTFSSSYYLFDLFRGIM